MRKLFSLNLARSSLLATTALFAPATAFAFNTLVDGNDGVLPLPTGLYVTPTAPLTNAVQQPLNPGLAAYPNFVAGEAVKALPSPDGTLLAVLTAGANGLYTSTAATDYANSTQYIFIYKIAGANKTAPVLSQVIKQNNAYVGLVWAPDGSKLYATGGNDDAVYVYANTAGTLSSTATAVIQLGHTTPYPAALTSSRPSKGLGLSVQPEAAGLAISADGSTLVVANNYNDSISIVNTATNTVTREIDLRQSAAYNEGVSGGVGGTFPYSVVVKGNATVYVGIDRDREVDVVDLTATAPHVTARIKVNGNPNGMTLNADQSTLYVAQDNADQVAVIATATNTVTANIDTRGPASLNLAANATGAAPTAVTISRDGNTLYAVNAGTNSVAVIPLTGPNALTVTGLIPTAYDPLDIAFSADGTWMYIVNGKSDTGPNPNYLYGNTAYTTTLNFGPGVTPAQAAINVRASNQYQFQLEHATLVSAAVPSAGALPSLTTQVAGNNLWNVAPPASDASTMNFLHNHIQHVIYIVKENRTFDQILGDLGNGSNGSPALTMFGKRITPNFHRMATNFVTLDNFMDPGDGSMDGWSWSMRGRVTNTETVTQQQNYANVNRGMSYEGEGQNRNIPSNLKTVAQRDFFFDATKATTPYTAATAGLSGGTANILPGDGDHAATDGPNGYQTGYIFNQVLNAGFTIRNYGWQANTPGSIGTKTNPVSDAFAAGIVQTTAGNSVIATANGANSGTTVGAGFFDPYFRAYDQNYPDLWRTNEFIRDVTANGLKNFSMIRGLSHDHTGSFSTALGGVNTPELQQADNDYAVGKLVAWLSTSQYAANTLVVVIEDDCQDGGDHVDSHRSTTYFVGPYVKQGAVVSTRYNQVNVLRTIEDIFGTAHSNLFTTYARPMADVFNINQSAAWSFVATPSTILKTTSLQLAATEPSVKWAEGPDVKPAHDWKYWASATRGFDFSGEDRVPADLYNKVLWQGIMGKKPFPKPHHSIGLDEQKLSSR